jgi:hypothetical protein
MQNIWLEAYLFSFLFAALFTACGQVEGAPSKGNAAGASNKTGAPIIAAIPPEINFGTVKEGTLVRRTFKIRNNGNAVLEIERVKGSCRCTAANPSVDNILPGREGSIEVTLNTMRRHGEVRKKVFIYSNDPQNPRLTLYLSGDIVREAVIEPQLLDFGEVSLNRSASAELSIDVMDSARVRISKVTIEDERFTLSMTHSTQVSNETYRIVFSGAEREGRIAGEVKIWLEGSEVPFITVPMKLRVVGNYRYAKDVYFSKKQGKYSARDIVITPRSKTKMRVRRVRDPDKLLHLQIIENESWRAIIRARVVDPRKKLSSSRHRLFIDMNDELDSKLELSYIINSGE